jgi:hypothetical protein
MNGRDEMRELWRRRVLVKGLKESLKDWWMINDIFFYNYGLYSSVDLLLC